MNNTVYLLSTSDLKDYSPINENVDDSLLHNAIMEAQEIELCQILGSCLYNRIIDLVNTDDIDNETDYKYLLDNYCRKVIVYAATMRAAVYIRYKIMNKSVSSQNSDNSTPVDLSELQYLIDHVKNDLEFFEKRLQEYLKENKDLYPEYDACECNGLAPQKQVFTTSLVIPNYPQRHYGYNNVK